MKVYFVRHGQTEFNLKKILMGQRFDVDLDRIGIAQAEELAAMIPKEVNLIFSSPLKRAYHTAMIIANKLNLSVITREELEERDYGSLSGKTWDEIEKEVGISLPHIEEQLNIDLSKYNSEKIDLIKFRLMHFLADLKKNYGDKVTVVVSHSGIIRIMYALYPSTPKLDVKNASLHTFEI
jgi:probable phosphoglycerate mutase